MISALMPTANRADVIFDRGEGLRLFAEDGRQFLDFAAGIATSCLGHGHPHLVQAISKQAGKIIHTASLYRVRQAEELAERHVAASFADSIFFCNSGAEANEGMVKAVRRYHFENGQPERYRMICFQGAFHGRTMAMISATGNPNYLKGFAPAVEGFDHVPYGDIEAVRAAITPNTAGIMLELIQGEGGVRAASMEFLHQLRAVCDEAGILLAFDEVQTGMGRTGKLWAHQWSDIEPDIMSSAKGIGGGYPIGAIFAKEAVARNLVPGTHGTTYGGGPLACAAGLAVLDVVLGDGFLDRVISVAQYFRSGLSSLMEKYPDALKGVQGKGLLVGLKLGPEIVNSELQAAAFRHGLLTLTAGQNVLRIAPPLIVTEVQCDEALKLLEAAILDLV